VLHIRHVKLRVPVIEERALYWYLSVCRQTLPWDYFPLARHPPTIGAKCQWSFQRSATVLVRNL